MTVDHSHFKLGRKPGTPDPRIPKLSNHMAMQVPAPSADWTVKSGPFGMLANNSIGDCTSAGCLHLLQVFYNNNGFSYTPTDDEALALYTATSDYPAKDEGAVESQVLTYWQQHGITTPLGTDRIAFASINPRNIDEIKLSVQYLGGCYFGISLPLTAQTQNEWSVVSTTGDGAPGSWGGHCCVAVKYDADYCYVVTWGMVLKASWQFIQEYCVEAYGIASESWLADSGLSPPGLNMAGLMREMESLAA